jgi:hypothetical protein
MVESNVIVPDLFYQMTSAVKKDQVKSIATQLAKQGLNLDNVYRWCQEYLHANPDTQGGHWLISTFHHIVSHLRNNDENLKLLEIIESAIVPEPADALYKAILRVRDKKPQ